MTSVVETLPVDAEPACRPGALRIGQLGLGNVGSALAGLTHRSAAALHDHGISLETCVALVRSVSRPRPAAAWVGTVTDDPDLFFAQRLDIVVEMIGGIDPAFALVRRALDRGIPVVTANKSLVAVHGEALSDLARHRNTAFRYEASCIAGVPFIGTFERRPLASRVDGLTAILNGTSNTILTAVANGDTFAAALAEAQRRGFAEPDPTADVSGRDAAEKLTLLIRRFGQRLVAPAQIPTAGITGIHPTDLRAARALGGTLKPVAHASWTSGTLEAFVSPAFLPATHPLAGLSGATNGILIDAPLGRQCYIGPGAGPNVTAATLLDDVYEVATEPHVRTPPAIASTVTTPQWARESGWFLRIATDAPAADISQLLATYGVWTSRIECVDGCVHALTFCATPRVLRAALDAVATATRADVAGYPVLSAEEPAC
jgi:homoserine dehydrogenase